MPRRGPGSCGQLGDGAGVIRPARLIRDGGPEDVEEAVPVPRPRHRRLQPTTPERSEGEGPHGQSGQRHEPDHLGHEGRCHRGRGGRRGLRHRVSGRRATSADRARSPVAEGPVLLIACAATACEGVRAAGLDAEADRRARSWPRTARRGRPRSARRHGRARRCRRSSRGPRGCSGRRTGRTRRTAPAGRRRTPRRLWGGGCGTAARPRRWPPGPLRSYRSTGGCRPRSPAAAASTSNSASACWGEVDWDANSAAVSGPFVGPAGRCVAGQW